MTPTELASLGTAVAAVLGAVGLIIRNNSQSKTEAVEVETVDRKALADAVQTVQLIYSKITEDLQTQVDHLIERDRECRSELEQAKADIHQLRGTTAHNSQAIEEVKVKIEKDHV